MLASTCSTIFPGFPNFERLHAPIIFWQALQRVLVWDTGILFVRIARENATKGSLRLRDVAGRSWDGELAAPTVENIVKLGK